MFDNQPVNQTPPNNLPANGNPIVQNGQTPPPPLPKTSTVEPEDIFGKIDPLPVAPKSEPVIKNTPSIFTAPLSPKTDGPSPINIEDLTAPPKTLDTKSIILIVAIVVIVLGTVAAGVWWFVNNKKNQAANSSTINLFDNLNQNTPPVNNNTDSVVNNNPNLNANTNVNASLPAGTQPAAETVLPPSNPDTDSDGLTDEEESSLGTSAEAVDTDNDGLSDREEVKVYKTDPLKADTDGDGLNDGDEIKNKKDPLKSDVLTAEGLYTNPTYKFSFTPLAGMNLVSANADLVLFNDDVNQIKFYIYLNNSQPEDLQSPDWSYLIATDEQGRVMIKSSESLPDKTPVSSEFSTQNYEAPNGVTYTIRYVATKRGSDHRANFETLLQSFSFAK